MREQKKSVRLKQESQQGKVVISVSELRRIVREELASVMKAERKGKVPPQYREQVIQDWLQQINRQNKAIESAKKGTLNKPD